MKMIVIVLLLTIDSTCHAGLLSRIINPNNLTNSEIAQVNQHLSSIDELRSEYDKIKYKTTTWVPDGQAGPQKLKTARKLKKIETDRLEEINYHISTLREKISSIRRRGRNRR